jgi:hypothetical protein
MLRIYFTNHDVEGMFDQLEPLHEMMKKVPNLLYVYSTIHQDSHCILNYGDNTN